MIFSLLKILSALFAPPALFLIALCYALLKLKKNKVRFVRLLITAVAIIYYVLSIEPTAYIVAQPLEHRFISAIEEESAVRPTAILILGGGAYKEQMNGIVVQELGGASMKRLWRGIELYNDFDKTIPIIYAGGSGDAYDQTVMEADIAARIAQRLGVQASHFIPETHSRNTYENAVEAKKILDTLSPETIGFHHIALVTSARHIPRAERVLEALSIRTVDAYPTDFTPSQLRITPLSFIPSVENLRFTLLAGHEYIGLVVYWLRGYL
ncbi:MAG: YdcF family protein [Patescibacteria group bacterium]